MKQFLFFVSFLIFTNISFAKETLFNCQISYLEKMDGSEELKTVTPLKVSLEESTRMSLPLQQKSEKLADGFIDFEIDGANVSLNINTPILCLQNQEICIDDFQESSPLNVEAEAGYGHTKLDVQAGFFVRKNKESIDDSQYVQVLVECSIRKKSTFSFFGN